MEHTLGGKEVDAADAWRVAPLAEAEHEAVRALFQDVFGQPMLESLWHWKYGDGRGINLAAWHGNDLVGHYGGLTRRIWLAGRPALALQGSDAMVRPSERQRGVLFRLSSSAMEREVGTGKRHDLMYGFPNARHMRIAEKHGTYQTVGRMHELRWLTERTRRSPWLKCTVVDPESPSLGETVRILWLRMLDALSQAVLVERGADYLAYRYARHPAFKYRVYLVRWRLLRRPVGLFVLKHEGREVEWMDLVARPSDIARMLPFVRQAAADLGAHELVAWVCAAHAHWFRAEGAQEKDLQIPIPSQVWSPGIGPEEVRDRWWLMSGDTDYR